MERINFQDGTKISSAKVTIDGVDYPVTPARYTGATPLSALVLNTMQDNIEAAIEEAGGSVVVSPTEPTTDRKKVWLRHSKNLWGGFTYTIENAHVTYIQNYDGSIKINGTASASSGPMSISTMINNGYSLKLKAGTYTISGYTSQVDLQCYSANATQLASKTSPTFTIENETIVTIRPYLLSGTSVSNVTINIQLEKGETPTTYEPYVEDKTYILNGNDIYEEYNDNKENILYEAESTTTPKATINFSDITNYDYIEIYYQQTTGANGGCLKLIPVTSTNITLNQNSISASAYSAYLRFARYNLTTTSLTFVNYVTKELGQNSFTSTNSTNISDCAIVITKIVGYK